ncbi:unnamed protein product [Nezara viridula]|uniref:Uncharacterized protein n=1 Tax=Nezara viridula TaxID=85310 RepID=A0A9P0HP59_NEZVI|nr:unnamed protein product [Nezara viridula]
MSFSPVVGPEALIAGGKATKDSGFDPREASNWGKRNGLKHSHVVQYVIKQVSKCKRAIEGRFDSNWRRVTSSLTSVEIREQYIMLPQHSGPDTRRSGVVWRTTQIRLRTLRSRFINSLSGIYRNKAGYNPRYNLNPSVNQIYLQLQRAIMRV